MPVRARIRASDRLGWAEGEELPPHRKIARGLAIVDLKPQPLELLPQPGKDPLAGSPRLAGIHVTAAKASEDDAVLAGGV